LKIFYPLGQNFQNDLYEAEILEQRQMGSFSTVSALNRHPNSVSEMSALPPTAAFCFPICNHAATTDIENMPEKL
jgi:hypothetical protein